MSRQGITEVALQRRQFAKMRQDDSTARRGSHKERTTRLHLFDQSRRALQDRQKYQRRATDTTISTSDPDRGTAHHCRTKHESG